MGIHTMSTEHCDTGRSQVTKKKTEGKSQWIQGNHLSLFTENITGFIENPTYI